MTLMLKKQLNMERSVTSQKDDKLVLINEIRRLLKEVKRLEESATESYENGYLKGKKEAQKRV